MTYGEAHIAEKNSLKLKKGMWQQTLFIRDKAQPMKKEEACRYYNTKLFDYWLDTLNKNATWIKTRMFGHPNNAKLNEKS